MLKFLNIVNFAVIPQLRVELHEGLNLLTGETGAGKSIIVDALSLLLGARSSPVIIRTGERAALVEGTFELKSVRAEAVRSMLGTIGIGFDVDDALTIRRELQVSGRNRIFVNDQNVTAATLKALQQYLLEIHGQGEQQALMSPRAQLRLLDAVGGCDGLRAVVSETYGRWRRIMESLRTLDRDEFERARTLDLLRYQLSELERINPLPEEEEALAAEKRLLMHAANAVELNAKAYAALYESDESVLERLALIRRWLQDLESLDPRVLPILEALATATISLMDAAESLRQHGAGLVSSPERLAEIDNRLAELERLKRKYGRSLHGLQEIRAELAARLNELENWTARENELLKERESLEREYGLATAKLTACRQAVAPQLAARVSAGLKSVALDRAHFSINVETARLEAGWSEESATEEEEPAAYWTTNGADRVQFMFSANLGEEERPLKRIASGGELSRLMLLLRTSTQAESSQAKTQAEDSTLVFDEIDVGIGGRAAESVGRRLKLLAATQQVLCVTHQPQIARFADHHYVVEKHAAAGRTMTVLREVKDEARVGELARMIGGADDIATARETARWMIESASEQEDSAPTVNVPGRKQRGPRGRVKHGR
ncbi:MAG: DNA repair protein RecN [Pyrinomonadaceae bacterium]